MENRKRKVQIIVRVTEEERALIEEKMKMLPTQNLAAYARKPKIIDLDSILLNPMLSDLLYYPIKINPL